MRRWVLAARAPYHPVHLWSPCSPTDSSSALVALNTLSSGYVLCPAVLVAHSARIPQTPQLKLSMHSISNPVSSSKALAAAGLQRCSGSGGVSPASHRRVVVAPASSSNSAALSKDDKVLLLGVTGITGR